MRSFISATASRGDVSVAPRYQQEDSHRKIIGKHEVRRSDSVLPSLRVRDPGSGVRRPVRLDHRRDQRGQGAEGDQGNGDRVQGREGRDEGRQGGEEGEEGLREGVRDLVRSDLRSRPERCQLQAQNVRLPVRSRRLQLRNGNETRDEEQGRVSWIRWHQTLLSPDRSLRFCRGLFAGPPIRSPTEFTGF